MAETFSFEEAKTAPPSTAEQVDSSFTMEDMLHAAVDAKKSGVSSFTVPRAGGGTVLMTPERAAGVASYIPTSTPAAKTLETFSFEEAQKPQPKKDEPGLLERLRDQSLPAIMGRFAASSNLEMEAMGRLGIKGPDGKSALDKERERRQKAGEKTDTASMLKWASDTSSIQVHGKPPPDTPIDTQMKQIWDSAVADPIKFGKTMLEGAFAHPEYFTIVGFVTSPLQSVMEQVSERGKVDWGEVGLDTVLGVAPAAVIHGALHLGNARVAAVKGKPVKPEAEVRAVSEVKAKIEQGTPPLEATDQVLEAMGVKAEERKSIVNDVKEISDATQEGKVPQDNQPQHLGTDTPRVEAAQPQADRGDRPVPSEEVRPKEEKVAPAPPKEAEVIRPQQFTPLPEGLQKRMVSPEETFAVLKEAGLDEEAAKGMAGNVPIAIGALRQRLTKFMGGQKYADSVLADVLLNKKQAGRADPRLLAAMAAVGLGAAGTYALTEDKSKAIQTAMWLGATAAAVAAAGRVGRSVRSMFDRMQSDKTLKPMGPFNEFDARPKMVERAVQHWERTTDALLTGIKDKDAARIRVRDSLQGHTDVKLTLQEQHYADEVRKFLDTLGNMAHDAGAIERLRENYLTGLYQKKPFKAWKDILRELTTEEAFRGNYTGMSRNSRFNLQKTIPDYRTAERLHAEGKFPLIPLTNDPVKIAGMYARSVQKTIAVDKLITDLKNTPGNRLWAATGIPVPVIIGMNAAESLGKIVKANAETGRHLAFDPEGVKAMDKFATMDVHSDYEMVRHPSLNGMLVHKDVAPMLKMLFDTSDPTMIHRALYNASMAAKGLFFTVSMFHPVALGVVAATLALPRLRSITTMPRYWREIPAARAMLRNGDNIPGFERAARSNLEFMRAPQDMDPNIVSRVLNYAQDALGPVGLPLKGLRIANDWVQNFLWNELFPTLKLASFNAEVKAAELKDPKYKPEVGDKQIAKGVNDMFGGQNWFALANDVPSDFGRRLAQALFSPYGRRMQQIMFLAPDWNISAARAWYEGIKSVVPGIDRKASDSMYRNYLVWSGLTYLGAANMLSNHYTGHNIWDQKDWTYVDRGDGTKVQLNKHYMEMAHLVMSPQKFLLNKLNLMPKEVIDQFFGKEWVSYDEKKGVYGPPMEQYPFGLTRPVHAAKTFVPLSIANIIRDPGAGISGMFSIGVYGTPYEQREETAAKHAADKGKDVGAARATARKRREKERTEAFKEQRVIP